MRRAATFGFPPPIVPTMVANWVAPSLPMENCEPRTPDSASTMIDSVWAWARPGSIASTSAGRTIVRMAMVPPGEAAVKSAQPSCCATEESQQEDDSFVARIAKPISRWRCRKRFHNRRHTIGAMLAPYLRPYARARGRKERGARALLWMGRRDQLVRFEAIVRDCPLEGLRLLDVGCGPADLLGFLH